MNARRFALALVMALVLTLVPAPASGQGVADLVVIKNDMLSLPVQPGSTIIYQIAYINLGPSSAAAVQLLETVPQRTTFNPGASDSRWACSGGGDAGAPCTLDIGSLPLGASATVLFAVNVDDPLTCGANWISNSVAIASGDPDSNYSNNSSVEQSPVDQSGCSLNGQTGCAMTPRYYMYTLEDADQPAGWQPYCYVVSSSGPPSAESQARVCTVPGSDHTYRATNLPYAGWVYADCTGQASYGWPDWQPEWYRPGFAR